MYKYTEIRYLIDMQSKIQQAKSYINDLFKRFRRPQRKKLLGAEFYNVTSIHPDDLADCFN